MKTLGFLMIGLGLLSACGDDDGRGDAGVLPGDSSVMFDSTSPGDTGIVLVDSGVRPDGDTTPDSGTRTDSGVACTPRPVAPLPASELPRCAASTLTCIMACTAGDAACQQACTNADTTPASMMINCPLCISVQGISCAVANGCDAQYNAVDCCIQANSCADQACINTNCGTEVSAFQTCTQGTGATCAPAQQMCFASE